MNELETMATTFIDVNLAKLIAAKDLVDACDAGLVALNDSLPSNFPLEAKRKINELRSAIMYARTSDLPNLIVQYTPSPVADVPVQDTPQA
ncbi:hypothetical protein QP179_10055 [Sphingomonas aurantiaca]|uniref:hypothetical protein n=1 Tax=Sphingomonas aurantiaca TaxID=185949 RepID=UPI002FE0D114